MAYVPSREVLLDFRAGGKGLGVGRFAASNRLEVALPTVFMGQVKLVDGSNEVTLEDYIIALVDSLQTPQIITQPTNRTINLGDAITISLVARGIGLTYQWYFKKTDQSTFSPWNNHTSASENVTPNATWDGIQLYCDITGSSGTIVRSNTITITVNQ